MLLGAVGLAALIRPFCGSCRAALPATAVPLGRFRRAGERTDTPALERALGQGQPVWLAAGQGSGPGGAYILDGAILVTGTSILGDGPDTLIMPDPHGSGTCFRAIGPLSGVALSDLKMVGLQKSHGFAEHVHLLDLSGVSEVLINRVEFEAWQGDAIYLGAGWPTGSGLQNKAVEIRDCKFDGLARECRNAVSVISGSEIQISGCIFRNCTRNDMPGPVDFETNTFGVDSLSVVSISDCRFVDCGGSAGQITLIAARAARNAFGSFTVTGNTFLGYRGTGADIHVDLQSETSGQATPLSVLIEDNFGEYGLRPMALKAGEKIVSRGNSWSRYPEPVLVGTAHGETVGSVEIADSFDSVGSGLAQPAAIDLYDVNTIDLTGSKFARCGSAGTVVRTVDGFTNRLMLSSTGFITCPGLAHRLVNPDGGKRVGEIVLDGSRVRRDGLHD